MCRAKYFLSTLVAWGLFFLATPATLSAVSTDNHAALNKASMELQTFYHHPSLQKLESITQMMPQMEAARPSQRVDSLCQTFVTMAIYKNKTFVSQIVQDFPTYSDIEQALYYKALLANQESLALKEIKKTGTYHVNPLSVVTPHEIESQKLRGADDFDLNWSAYFATGDSVYLEKFLKYIHQIDPQLLPIAHKIYDEQVSCDAMKAKHLTCPKDPLKNIIATINQVYPNQEKEKFLAAADLSSLLWSLDSNADQDSMVSDQLNTIVAKEPDLDYRKAASQMQ
jgi:hypothetical protein